MTILTQAAEFAGSVSPDRLPEEIFEIGKRALIDYFGVALAGSREPVSRVVQSYVSTQSTVSESTVLGTDLRAPRNLAALANGVAGHALDYDDVSWTTIGHPTVTVAPSVLATGETVEASGRQLLTAYIVGVEIAHKIAELTMPGASEKGWHTTSVFGPLGAAAASAHLMQVEKKAFADALGIAASTAGGIRANFGTMTKAFHAGMAAFNGTTAAMLARLGLTASDCAIEAQDGFVQVFDGNPPNDGSVAFGRPWDILKPGLVFKKYPCCSGTHPAVDCLQEMQKETPFSADQVESIHVGVSLLGPRELIYHSPKTVTEARFSMAYALAAALRYGKVSLAQFKESCLEDPVIIGLIPKITMKTDPELAKLGLIGTAPAKLRIVLDDGRTLYGRCDLAKGNPENPMSDEELYSKFLDCVSESTGAGRAKKILDSLRALETVENIGSLMEMI